MMQRETRRRLILVSLAVVAVAGAIPAGAEVELRLYGGAASTSDTDVRYTRPDGTDLVFSGVGWSDDSFSSPPYYGLSVTAWLDHHPAWSVGVEFDHPKMIARRSEMVMVSGLRGGQPVDGEELLGDTFEILEFTDGYNLFLATVGYRLFAEHRAMAAEDRVRPYFGLGIGVAVPHVEVSDGVSSTLEFQVAGPAAQAMAGVTVPLWRELSFVGEGKVAWADVDAELEGGGRIELEPWTGQLAVGLSYRF